jgi:hypothetical protein
MIHLQFWYVYGDGGSVSKMPLHAVCCQSWLKLCEKAQAGVLLAQRRNCGARENFV